MSTHNMAPASARRAFYEVSSAKAASDQDKTPSPFCIRLTAQERAILEHQAGNQALGAYIRDQLLGENVQKRRKLHRPDVNDQQIAAVLAMLGRSRMPSNLNQLAKQANMGTLDITRDVNQELHDACKAVLAMRDALLIALGQRPMTRRQTSQ